MLRLLQRRSSLQTWLPWRRPRQCLETRQQQDFSAIRMTTRVDQIALHVRKLAQATGVQSEKKGDLIRDPALDGVTSDLDIEALSKGLLDISKDLDLYLQTLVEPPDLPVVNIKADIAHLENEIKEKDELLEKTLETIRKAEATFRKLRQRQLRSLYYL